MKWNETGDAFIILNTQEFLKILPGYFKTKNFASFVRQLNMYNFYKVKSKRNQQEFRHPFFRRDQANDLKYIKRKNVNKKLKQCSESPVKEEPLSLSNINVKEQIDKLQGVLDFIAEQNKTLIKTNKDIISQLYSSKGECEAQIKELLSMMFVTISVNNAKLTTELRDYLTSLKINQSMIPNSVFLERNMTNIDAIIQNNSDKEFSIPTAIEKLISIYKSNLPDSNLIRPFNQETRPEFLPERRQALTVIKNQPDKTPKPNSNEDPSKLTGPSGRSLEPENSHPAVIKRPVSENRISSLVSIKNELMLEDLNRADQLFNNLYNERDNDLVSLSEFIYTPVTPLFQEEI